ncbi:MAG: IS200/IS605 family transposase [Candidatus Diapherotrites archaeon]
MIEKANHCVFDVKYHMVLCVKYRKKLLLTEEVVHFLEEVMHGLQERYFLFFETIGCDRDHCHVLVRAKPRYAPSKVMRVIKSISARKLFERFKWLRQELWGGEFWSDGGYIGTVGEGVNADIIRKYIEKQGRKYDKSQMKIIQFL